MFDGATLSVQFLGTNLAVFAIRTFDNFKPPKLYHYMRAQCLRKQGYYCANGLSRTFIVPESMNAEVPSNHGNESSIIVIHIIFAACSGKFFVTRTEELQNWPASKSNTQAAAGLARFTVCRHSIG